MMQRFHVLGYRNTPLEQGYEAATINKNVNILQAFNRYLIESGIMDSTVVDLYGNKKDMLIHEYSLATKKDRNLEIDGYAPQYSPDEKYLVFDKYKGSSTYPCVMRISDGYEWIYENSNVWQMQFSKDASKLLFCEPNNNSFDQSIQQIVFWDYKNEKVKRLQIVYRSNSPFLLFK